MVRRIVFLCFIGMASVLVGVSSCTTPGPRLRTPSAWTWFNDPRAFIVDRRLIIGSVDTGGYSRVDMVDLDTNRVVDSQRLSQETQVDDHNNPAILKLGNGQILAAYARHSRDAFWCTRLGHLDAESGHWQWSEENRHVVNASVTYSNLFQLSAEQGRIYNFFRGLNFNPCFSVSDDHGQSWSQPKLWMQIGEGRTRPYVKFCSDGENRIDFLYTEAHPRDFNTSVYHLYYEAGQLFRSDGTRVGDLSAKLTVQPTDGTLLYDGRERRAWVWDIKRYENGQLACVFVVSHDGEVGRDLRYYHGFWNGRRWNVEFVAHAGSHLYEPENHYAGGIVLDPEDSHRVFLSTNCHPPNREDQQSHYRIYQGWHQDWEESWEFAPLTSEGAEDQIRPYACGEVLLWLQGDYHAYTEFRTHVHWTNLKSLNPPEATR